MNKPIAVVLLLLLAAGCSGMPRDEVSAPPLDATRTVSEQDCTKAVADDGGNLLCREITQAERLARIAALEREASARLEAQARAERERLERERAEQLAREEAARKVQEERERREKAEAELRARLKAEQEAREAAARECRRLEQERKEGRSLLAVFVADYGKDEEFKDIAGQIAAFLAKPRKVKPCPPA